MRYPVCNEIEVWGVKFGVERTNGDIETLADARRALEKNLLVDNQKTILFYQKLEVGLFIRLCTIHCFRVSSICGVSSLDYNHFDFWQHNQSNFLHFVN